MEKIIGLYGKGSCGKTATLNFLIDLLTVATTSCPMPTPHTGDRKETFTYNDKVISICTDGDYEEILEENISYFNKQKCDIVITATRTRGKTCDALNTFASKNKISTVDWIKKSYDAKKLEEKMNLQTARDIFNQL